MLSKKRPYENALASGRHGGAWLKQFSSDRWAILDALETWNLWAHDAFWSMTELIETQDHQYLRIAPDFHSLTALLALWCDAVLQIDPMQICEFERYVEESRIRNIAMPDGGIKRQARRRTEAELEDVYGRARIVFDRAWNLTVIKVPTARGEDDNDSSCPAYQRDQWMLRLHQNEKLGPAAIRDRWDSLTAEERMAICPRSPDTVGGADSRTKAAGCALVKKAIQRAKARIGASKRQKK